MTTKIYIVSRMVHRVLVLAVTFSALIMTVTGFLMKFPKTAKLFNVGSDRLRFIHSNFGVIFLIILFLMTLTGLIIYFYPLSRKK